MDVSGVLSQAPAWGMAAWKYTFYTIISLVGGSILYFIIWNVVNSKRYTHKIVIWEKGQDGKPRIIGYDIGGLFINKKTNYRLFLLKKNKVGLSPDDVPYIEDLKKGLFGRFKSIKTVNVLKLGLKQFRYMQNPTLQHNSPLNIDYGVGDADVAWGINTIELAKQYEKKSVLSQLMPYLGMAFVFMAVIAGLYFIFVKAGFNADLIKSLATSAQEISKNMAVANSGTTVVG